MHFQTNLVMLCGNLLLHPLSSYLSRLCLCQLMSKVSHNVIAIKLREHTHRAIVPPVKEKKTCYWEQQHVLWQYCLHDYRGCHQCRNLYLCLLCCGFLLVKLMNACCKMVCKKKSPFTSKPGSNWCFRLLKENILQSRFIVAAGQTSMRVRVWASIIRE